MTNTRRGKAIMAVLIIAVLMLSGISPALAVSGDGIQTAADKLISFFNQQADLQKDALTGNDWQKLGLRWLGSEVGPKQAAGQLSNASDYARDLLGQIAAGAPTATINAKIAALQGLQDANIGSFNTPNNASLNQTIWSVIALDYAADNGFAVNYNKTKALTYIVSQQDAGGGFDESGWGVDVDSTAHALIALAPYKASYPTVIDKALAYLKIQQVNSGGFQAWGGVSPDSTATVIEALIALGEDPQNPSGTGWKGNMVETLLTYQQASGSFGNAYTNHSAILALSDLVKGKSKYQNALPATSGICVTVTVNGMPKLDSDAGISVKLQNAFSTSKNCLVIAALYDKSSGKLNAYSSINQTISGNGEFLTDYGVSLPSSGNYELRIYIWDNWTDRTPLVSPTIIPLQ